MANSDKDDEFAFNLFTDIAPLLALLGDQFARQFTSESLTWVDHLISAMVPLGILGYITGAIRVQGPRLAKSFIGRGRENRALAEIELMSSTSNEVCELFNGKSIIRVMGKPTIAQILIYPTEYDALKKKYEEEDQKRLRLSTSNDRVGSITSTEKHKSTTDRSCGLHTFETALSQGDSRAKLLKVAEYESHSHQIIRGILSRLTGRPPFEDKPQSKNVVRSLGPPNLQLGLSSDQFQKGFPRKGHEILLAAVVAVVLQASLIAIATLTVYHESTKRAISFDIKNYGYSCYIIGSILLSVGVGVCSFVVERNTVEYDWKVLTRNKSGEESAPETIPTTSKNTDVTDAPRLLWLQKTQVVNDQAFGGFAILAGPKHHIITSSRIEDTTSSLEPTSDSKGACVKTRNEYHAKRFQMNSGTWELITVCAAIAAASGFVLQFIGLRGLTYPCSVAQLLAIIIMALARATIRRRLGREPYHCSALSRHEIDVLATRIVHYPGFRHFQIGLKDQIIHMNEEVPQKVLSWRVKTAKVGEDFPFFCNTLQDLREANQAPGKSTSTNQNCNLALIEDSSSQQLVRVRKRLGDLCKWHSEALESARSLVLSVETFMDFFFPEGLSNHSDLDWAIETFGLSNEPGVKTPGYVTIPVTKASKHEKWQVDIGTVEAILSLWMANVEAQAVEERKRRDEENAKKTTNSTFEKTNWRRTTSGIDLQYNYCRIIGDNMKDGTLKRDLCWWVDELIADESDSPSFQKESPHEIEYPETITETLDGVRNSDEIGATKDMNDLNDMEYFEDSDSEELLDLPVSKWTWSSARNAAQKSDLVIGFNGRLGNSDVASQAKATELAIYRSGLLPNILAQHLFISFIWTVVEHLPKQCLHQGVLNSEHEVEIEGIHTFDPRDFANKWHRPTLRHRQLTKLVRQIKEFGLGSEMDILLCMIPAFSINDLLPNHVILALIPQMRRGQGWAETARCYNRLLKQSLRVRAAGRITEEMLCYNVVVATIDFLVFAFEPYDKHFEPPYELKTELRDIMTGLASTRLAPIVQKLGQAYMLQYRNEDIAKIFEVCWEYDSSSSLTQKQHVAQAKRCRALAKTLKGSIEKLEFTFLENSLGFSSIHRPVYEALCRTRQTNGAENSQSRGWHALRPHKQKFGEPRIRNVKAPDIFGWTPLHYASLLQDGDEELLSFYFDPKLIKQHHDFHKVVSSFGRSPIHMVAISKSKVAMMWAMNCLDTIEIKRNAFEMVGIDGMSPVHLATKSGNVDLIKEIPGEKYMGEFAGLDFWGRTAIQLAAIYGRIQITSILLREGAQIDSIDDIGKAPLKYLLEDTSEWRNAVYDEDKRKTWGAEHHDHELDMNEADSVSVTHHGTNEPNSKITSHKSENLANRRLRIFETYALERPEYRDEKGRTLFHHAVEHTNLGFIKELLCKGYDANSKDKAGLAPLHIALHSKRPDIALALLKGFPDVSIPAISPSIKDLKGQTPLMLAATYGFIDVVKYLMKYYYPKSGHKEQVHSIRNTLSTNRTTEYVFEATPDLTCGPLAKDLNGHTALHLGIIHRKIEVSKFLLKSDFPIQEDPNGADGDSLLMDACESSSAEICPLIFEKWPELINKPDSRVGRTPLTWACRSGSEPIVDVLLEHDKVDVNLAAKFDDHVSPPLQIAKRRGRDTLVQKLLNHERIDIGAKNSLGNNAIVEAVYRAHLGRVKFETIQALFDHPHVSSKLRRDSLARCCRYASDHENETILKLLKNAQNAEDFGYLLLELIDITEDRRNRVIFEELVSTALRGEFWKRMAHPYHKAARVRSEESEMFLKDHPERLNDIDDDGWSCMDYAETYCRGDLTEPWKGNKLASSSNFQQPSYRLPGLLHNPKHTESVQVITCSQPDHKECFGNTVVKIIKKDKELKSARIRTVHCAPPFSAANKNFYFEVTIQDDSTSGDINIGFCYKGYPQDRGRDMFEWRSMNDDGALSISTRKHYWKRFINDPEGEPGAGDTIGFGLNLETGKGFVTLNGAMINLSKYIFGDRKFGGRKMYPWVGFDITESGIGMSFSINFTGSEDHPFMCKGPYPGD